MWRSIILGPKLSDAQQWNKPEYYSTIQCADINGDGQAEILARYIGGILAWYYDKSKGQWYSLPGGPQWGDVNGWNRPEYYSTIQCADFDGDGQKELIGRSISGILMFRYDTDGRQWTSLPDGPKWSDADYWNRPEYYSTIMAAELDGYGQDELIARSSGGMGSWQRDSVYMTTWLSVLEQAIADPAFGQRLSSNPIAELQKAGIVIPPERQQLAAQVVVSMLSPPQSPDEAAPQNQLRSTPAPTNTEYLSATQDWYGLTIYFSPAAVKDVDKGLSLKDKLAKVISAAAARSALASVAAATGPEVAIIVPVIVTYLVVLGKVIVMMDKGNGVNLIVPWTSFIPPPYPNTIGLVIPIPA
jgi:hypothetical protein